MPVELSTFDACQPLPGRDRRTFDETIASDRLSDRKAPSAELRPSSQVIEVAAPATLRDAALALMNV